MAYATTAALKREVGIDDTDTSQDLYLTDLLDWVSGWIDAYTGRAFTSGDTTITQDFFYPSLRWVFWLNDADVVSITTVKAKYLQGNDWTTLTADEYEWLPNGRLHLWTPARYVEVTYVHNAGGVPKAIEGACVEAAAKVYRNNNVTDEEIGDWKVRYSRNGPEDVFGDMGVLDAYKVTRI